MAAHQAPPSLGFSRQEHWSGLPFPSPMHESEKGKWSHSVVSNSSRPHGLQPTRLLHPWDFPGKSIGVGCHFLPQEVTKIYQIWTQNQANRKDWPEEAQKKCPKRVVQTERVIQTTMRVWLRASLFEPAHVSIHVYPFFPPNKYFVGILFCKAKGPGPGRWPLIYLLGFSAFTATTWIQWTKGHLKPLQAKATQGQCCICQFPSLIPSSFSLHVSVLC